MSFFYSYHFSCIIESLVNGHMRMNNHINMVYLHHSSLSDLPFGMVGVCSLLHVSYLCNNCVSFIQQIFLSTQITRYNIYFPYPCFPISQLNRHPFQISTNTSIQYRTQTRKHFLPLYEFA